MICHYSFLIACSKILSLFLAQINALPFLSLCPSTSGSIQAFNNLENLIFGKGFQAKISCGGEQMRSPTELTGAGGGMGVPSPIERMTPPSTSSMSASWAALAGIQQLHC
uniref:Uncharacterized protein n=1 Tax=Coturnix japonica TaxID=93934 RepID=A0A8C2SKI5_COTJA